MTKRGNGEGSISRRKDGRWQAVVTIGRNKDGKLIRKYFYGKTRKEVSELLSEAVLSIKNNEFIPEASNPTVNQWLRCWLDTYKKNSIKRTTFDQYANLLRRHIIPAIGDKKLVKLKTEHLQQLVNAMHEKGLSYRTIELTSTVLHGALKQAVKNKLIRENLADNIVLPLKECKEIYLPTETEQEQVIAALKDSHIGRAIILACYTGLRRGEILALKWTDFNEDERTLSVNKNLSRVNTYAGEGKKTELVVTSPKSAKSRRIVPLIDKAYDLLLMHRRLQQQYTSMVGELYDDNNIIFSSALGSYIDPTNVNRKLTQVTSALGIKNFGPHTLRHVFATRGLEANIPLKVMQEILGHSSVTVTGDIYTHVLKRHKNDAVEKLNGAF